MIITSITDSGFTVIDSNWAGYNLIDQRFYTWSEFVSTFSPRKLQYIEVYRGTGGSGYSQSYDDMFYFSDDGAGESLSAPSGYEEPVLPSGGGFR